MYPMVDVLAELYFQSQHQSNNLLVNQGANPVPRTIIEPGKKGSFLRENLNRYELKLPQSKYPICTAPLTISSGRLKLKGSSQILVKKRGGKPIHESLDEFFDVGNGKNISLSILSPLSVVWESKLKGNKFNILVIFNISGYEYFGCGMVFVVKRAGL